MAVGLPAADDSVDYDDPIVAGDVMVLRYLGPKGAPGMPEAGYIPIPMKLARAGVKDIVRISDGRVDCFLADQSH